MKTLYFAHLRADGCIRIPAAIIAEMNLPLRVGFAIEPDPESHFLYLEIIRPVPAAPETGLAAHERKHHEKTDNNRRSSNNPDCRSRQPSRRTGSIQTP